MLNIIKKCIYIFSYINLLLLVYSCRNSDEEVNIWKGNARFTISVDVSKISSDTTLTYTNDKAIILFPENYDVSKPIKLVVYCHSGGGYVNDVNSEVENELYTKYFLYLGYAVLDVNGIPENIAQKLKIDIGRTVGNPITVDEYKTAISYVKSKYHIENEIYTFANSNGGVVSFNLANLTNIPIKAQAGICPLISIKMNAWNISSAKINYGEFSTLQNRANIIRLYGMKPVANLDGLKQSIYEEDKVGANDPYEYILSKRFKYRVPYKIFQTKDDDKVLFTLAKNFVTFSQSLGAKVYLREIESGGHTSEPQKGVIGSFIFVSKKYYLTPTIYEVSKWFEENGGYKVKYDL